MPDAPATAPRNTALATALRWTLTLAIAVGGAWAARRGVLALRARSGTRLVLLDFARFEGCLMGAPAPREGDAPDRALAMAQGTGAPAWPHTCAPPLTALVHDAHEVADDDSSAEGLAHDADAMESALGEAVFWDEHVREGHVEPPAWVGAYVALRRSVAAFATRRGAALRAPEPPRHPRVPRPRDAAPPPPVAVGVPGGDEAELVDAVATPSSLAALLRDGRGRYTLCRIDPREAHPTVACDEVRLPEGYDVASMRLVPGDGPARLAALLRAPDARRPLLDPEGGRVVLEPGGEPDPRRDYFVGGDGRAWALSFAARVPELLVAQGEAVGRRALPSSLDVLAEQRALLPVGPDAAPLVAWLDTRVPREPVLRAFDPDRSRESVVARFAAPARSGLERVLVPCVAPGAGSYVLAGDARSVTLFATSDSRALVRGPSLDGPIAGVGLACDARGVSLHRDEDGGRAALFHCDLHACTPARGTEPATAASFARSRGTLFVATVSDAPSRAVRVARYTADRPAEPPAFATMVPSTIDARAVGLLASADGTLALFASAERTRVLLSRDAGSSFEPIPLAARP